MPRSCADHQAIRTDGNCRFPWVGRFHLRENRDPNTNHERDTRNRRPRQGGRADSPALCGGIRPRRAGNFSLGYGYTSEEEPRGIEVSESDYAWIVLQRRYDRREIAVRIGSNRDGSRRDRGLSGRSSVEWASSYGMASDNWPFCAELHVGTVVDSSGHGLTGREY